MEKNQNSRDEWLKSHPLSGEDSRNPRNPRPKTPKVTSSTPGVLGPLSSAGTQPTLQGLQPHLEAAGQSQVKEVLATRQQTLDRCHIRTPAPLREPVSQCSIPFPAQRGERPGESVLHRAPLPLAPTDRGGSAILS